MILCGYDGALELISKRVHFIQLSLPSPPSPSCAGDTVPDTGEPGQQSVCGLPLCGPVVGRGQPRYHGVYRMFRSPSLHGHPGLQGQVSGAGPQHMDQLSHPGEPIKTGYTVQVYSKQRYTVTMCNLVTDVQTV